jgi:hypothetical protein
MQMKHAEKYWAIFVWKVTNLLLDISKAEVFLLTLRTTSSFITPAYMYQRNRRLPRYR